MAKIGIKQTLGRQEISQPHADLSIQQPKTSLSIKSGPGKLTIDQTKAWEEMNLISPLKQGKKLAQESMSKLSRGTQRRAQQGDQLMKIENGGSPIVQQALINAQANKAVIQARENKVQHQYHTGGANIQMKQENYLNISFTNIN